MFQLFQLLLQLHLLHHHLFLLVPLHYFHHLHLRLRKLLDFLKYCLLILILQFLLLHLLEHYHQQQKLLHLLLLKLNNLILVLLNYLEVDLLEVCFLILLDQ